MLWARAAAQPLQQSLAGKEPAENVSRLFSTTVFSHPKDRSEPFACHVFGLLGQPSSMFEEALCGSG